jgi:uncharacterized protein with von Willebrand factor type A (vWA) domain
VTTPPLSPAPEVAATIARFCRVLREHDFLVSAAESLAAVRAASLIDVGDRREVHLALRTVLAARRDDLAPFDALFDVFWQAPSAGGDPGPISIPHRPRETKKTSSRPPSISIDRWMQGPLANDLELHQVKAATDSESLHDKDFSRFAPSELHEITRIARQIARRLAMRKSRRWQPARRGARADLRRSLRQSLRTGGDIIELARRARRRRKTRVVALCDVSGSMDLYSRFFLQFLFALQHSFTRVETFVFATRLSRVTDQLRGDRWGDALAGLAAGVRDWSGGTRIGAALSTLVTEWPQLLDRRTIVLVLSDGWDTGDPELLATSLAAIGRQAGRVIWLNPLLSSPAYRPETRGMAAALPHLDVFAPLHNLATLRALAPHLTL